MKKYMLFILVFWLAVTALGQDAPSRIQTQPAVLADLATRVGRSSVTLSDLGGWKWSYGTYEFVLGSGCIGAPVTDPAASRWQRWEMPYNGTTYVYLITDNAQTIILCNAAALTTPTAPVIQPTAAPVVTVNVPIATAQGNTGSLGGPAPTASLECFLPTRLTIGGSGIVTPGDPNWLRDEPRQSSAKIGEIAAGGLFQVSQGPICDPVSKVNYWYVTSETGSGWTGEGANGVYWLEPVTTEPAPPTIKVTSVTALQPASWVTSSQLEIQNVVFSPQAKYFVVLTTSGRAALYDANTQTLIKELQSPSQQAYTKIHFGTDDAVLATADVSNRVYVWDVSSTSVLGQLDVKSPITALSFSRDETQERVLAIATSEGQIGLWAAFGLTPNTVPLMTLSVEGMVETLDFSPDNRMLIARDINEKMMALWEVGE